MAGANVAVVVLVRAWLGRGVELWWRAPCGVEPLDVRARDIPGGEVTPSSERMWYTNRLRA